MTSPIQSAAQQVLDTVPLVMRTVRAQLRTHRRADISVPQLRAMGYIDRNDGASLSDLANYIGLTLPSMSKLIDGLVARKLIGRAADSRDRRRICLSLTPLGREELRAAHRSTERFLADQLSGLPDEDLKTVSDAMRLLKAVFSPESAVDAIPENKQ
ncbi:MAG TPA: MarR family winged helix-turn-helix transcriptional regulator [Anaerolineales bacterium]|nr:MarR family winged helix-turn-helix transcriptional regulator [Anaerolineales bacterium]